MIEEFKEFLSYCSVPWRTVFWVNLTGVGKECCSCSSHWGRDTAVLTLLGQRQDATHCTGDTTSTVRLFMSSISNIPHDSCTSVITKPRWVNNNSEPKCLSSVGSEDPSDGKKRVIASTAAMSLRIATTAKIFMKTLSLTTRMTYSNGLTWISVMAITTTVSVWDTRLAQSMCSMFPRSFHPLNLNLYIYYDLSSSYFV